MEPIKTNYGLVILMPARVTFMLKLFRFNDVLIVFRQNGISGLKEWISCKRMVWPSNDDDQALIKGDHLNSKLPKCQTLIPCRIKHIFLEMKLLVLCIITSSCLMQPLIMKLMMRLVVIYMLIVFICYALFIESLLWLKCP